jgi:hypothetical protein
MLRLIFKIYTLLYVLMYTSCFSTSVPEVESIKSKTYNEFNTDDKLNNISNINFRYYYDKPIDSLLSNQLFNSYRSKRFVTEPVGCLWYLTLAYKNKEGLLHVNIYPNDSLQYLKRCIDSPTENWSLDLFRKEILNKVILDTFLLAPRAQSK